MIILSFDVSTTSTGCVLLDTELPSKFKTKLFTASGKLPYDRIRIIAKDVMEWIKDKEFDMVLITKASYSQMSPNILQLEGILLGIAVQRNIPFDYFGDSSWYSLIGEAGDERPTKKKRSVERFINMNNLEDVKKEINFHGKKLDKINVFVREWTEGVDPVPEAEYWITDDIADAWNAAQLYPKRLEREKIRFEKSETQKEINALRSETKKFRQRIKILKQDIRYNDQEKLRYKKEFEATGHKGKENSYLFRVDKEMALDLKLEKLKSAIYLNEEEVKKLMQKKNEL